MSRQTDRRAARNSVKQDLRLIRTTMRQEKQELRAKNRKRTVVKVYEGQAGEKPLFRL